MSKLALFGGPKAVQTEPGDLFDWPIFNKEHEEAAVQVIRDGSMSNTNITKEFEAEFAKWNETKYALGFHNGTASLQAAMYAVGLGVGDEIISPSVTYWASTLQAYSLGATPVFADIDPETLCIDPKDIEHRISEKTKAIMVVHYLGMPVDMDPIMEIAEKHNLKVIEDVSHAQGGLYKGRKLGTIGHVAAMSLMGGKSFAIGEAGILVTDDKEMYERAISFGHHCRHGLGFDNPELQAIAGLPQGGVKYRMHQVSSAVGLVELKYHDAKLAEIDQAMTYFWDQLEGLPGIRAHRPAKDSGSTMGGWYACHGLYKPEELKGLSVTRFCEALKAEGVPTYAGCNKPLHTHPLFQTVDVYGHGKPTRIANAERDVRELDKTLPVSEQIGELVYSIPWFKYHRPEVIDEYVNAFKKVIENYEELLEGDAGNPDNLGGFVFYKQK